MKPTELLLIRHGQSEANVGIPCAPDCALTEAGVAQAREAARRLASLDLSGFTGVVSPYRRAVQTAREISAATGVAFAEDEAVREWGVTATVGSRTFENEPVEEVVRRLEAFLRARRGARLVIVSHAAPIALLTQLAWGETPTTQGQFWVGVGNCCPRWVKTTAL
jgi:broad specificity phosphatase PhoE